MQNDQEKPQIFFLILFLLFIINKNVHSVDDSDILIDRVFITAVKKSNYQKVEEMLDKDVAVNYKDSNDLVALAYALENDDKKMFDMLIAGGADSKVSILKKSSLLIFYVAMNKYLLIDELVKTGVNVQFQDRLGMTALMHSIEKANVNAVNILLNKEVNTELTDFSGKTIFDYADSSRNLLIKKLVESLKTSN